MSGIWDDATREEQFVLYAAATHSTLFELLTEWQPWQPDLEWSDIAVHIPGLAAAVLSLIDRGYVELFYGPPDGEVGLISEADVHSIVYDPANWWAPDSLPQTELVLTPTAGKVGRPNRALNG